MGPIVERGSAGFEPARMPDLASSLTRQDASVEPRWYAVRTRSRHEKRVQEHLAGRPGIEV